MRTSFFQRKEQEQLLTSEGRLPPGQSLTLKFPVLHYGSVPRVNLATWDFQVFGEVEQPMRWNWEEFNKLPRTKLVMDIHCVTRWSKYDTTWEGVSVRTLVEQGIIKLNSSARYVIQHAEHGFTANLPLDVVLSEAFLMATHFDGEPLSADHGFPLRGVVGYIPGRNDIKTVYFWKGAKWLRGLEFTKDDQPGFWEQAGYHNEADVWQEQRVIW